MLGERIIKNQIRHQVEKVLVKYIKNEKDLNEACDGIAQVAIDIINIIGMRQALKLLWYAKRVNLLRLQSVGNETVRKNDVT